MAKSPVPKGYTAVTPYLRVAGAARAIDFYERAFGAREVFRLTMGDSLGHAEIEIAGARIMLSDEFPEMGVLGPRSLGGTTVTLMLYVADCDAVIARAIAAGATLRRPAKDEFYGDRTGQVEDPFGHVWMIQQQLAEVSPEEMQRRLDALLAGGGEGGDKAAPRANAAKATAKSAAKAKAASKRAPAGKKRG